MIRRSALSCAAVLCIAGGSGCGAGHRRSDDGSSGTKTHAAPTGVTADDNLVSRSKRDGDDDIDTFGRSPYDNDNDAVPSYGTAADAADRKAIVAAIHRYYLVAAAGDGATACSLLDPLAAEAVVEHHHRGVGPPSLQGDTCAQTVSKLFRQRHRELTEDVTAFRVTYVKVRGNRGYAYALFAAAREMEIAVRRKDGVWRMDVPLDSGAV
jgi:hypothetical protein